MSDIAIRVENLSKMYRIGRAQQRHDTLRDLRVDTLRSSFRGRDGSPEEDTIWALKDLSFEVKRGEVVGVIGPNGAGKSTLLKILTRIVEPTGGSFDLYGRVGSLLEVGTAFHPELTGRENVYLNGAILGMTRAEINRRFDEIVDFSGVEKFLDTPVKRYSSGMQIRLAFAVAAHLEPEIMLVDEVLAVGDADFQKKCLGKMEDVAQGGRTVLFVSHAMAHVTTICSRVILLGSGSIIRHGTSKQVIEHYFSSANSQNIEFPTWDSPETAPGIGNLRLHTVRILQDDSPHHDVAISKDVLVEIQFWNLKPGSRLQLGIHLWNSLQVCIFASHNWPENSLTVDPWYNQPCPQGLFRSTCRIPKHLLNDGRHSVSVFVLDLNNIEESVIDAQHVVAFSVYDTGAMRTPDISFGDWIGAIRPKLAWFTEYVT